ncbi:MAG: hypothetical protein IT249_21275 [Chitinophagaceae bacterium]|nr:hypothetical protein [Chitinophagaceae bacterium]
MKSILCLVNRLPVILLAMAIAGNSACKKEEKNNQQAANIERMALLLDYEVGYGGYVYPVYNPYIFFKNGVALKEPYIPPDEINTNALTKDIAQDWGTWKKNDDQVTIHWQSGNSSNKDWPGNDCFAAGINEKLQGGFSSFAGGGTLSIDGEVGILDYRSMSFTNDGWFTNTQIAGGGNSNVSAYSEQTTAGRYSIDGYSITLTFNSGDVKRLFFCFYGNDKTVFSVAGRTYTK